VAAEVNDPRGLAVAPDGALFVTDGYMHVIRVVPATTGTLLGRAMTSGDLYTAAGALPVATAEGLGDGTRWVVTRMGLPSGVAVSATGSVYFSDAALDALRVIGSP
jgi:streptogramin lyase